MPKIRVVCFQDKETDTWFAQCLEHDIAAFGSDLDEVQENLLATLDAEAKYTIQKSGKIFDGIGPAPKEFFDRWDKCNSKLIPSKNASIDGGSSLSDFTDQLALCA